MRTALFVVWAMAVSIGIARAETAFDESRLNALLVGKSAMFADGSISTYNVDGSYSYVAASNRYYTGRYTISDGNVCLVLDGGDRRCDTVSADAYGVFFVNAAGQVLRFSLHAPITLQNVTTICGVQVAYNVYPPPAYLPQEVKAFSGTWIGKWDYGMWGALIVESIKASGVASVIYINGDFALHSYKPGVMRFLALISGDTLTDGGRTASFEATMKDRDSLSVRRIGGPGAGTAHFNRR